MSIYLEQTKLARTIESVLLPPPIDNLQIDQETPISFDANGNVKSRFKDNIWDFTAIATKGAVIGFDADKYSDSTIIEIKTIMYARIYWSPSLRSISSLRLSPIYALADWSSKNNITIQKLLNDDRLALGVSSSLAALPARLAKAISAVVNEITKMRLINDNFTIAPTNFILAERLENIAQAIPNERVKQTAVIPTRIYAELITNFSSFLNEFNEHSQRIEKFYNYIITGLKTGGHLETGGGFKKWYKSPKNYEKIIIDHDLADLVAKYDLRDKKRWNVYLRDVQETSKYWIHLFTGMRDQEVNSLERECIGSVNTNGLSSKIIQGYTTKTIGSGATATYWITTDIVEVGMKAALTLGSIAASQNEWEIHPNNFPLLPTLFSSDKAKHRSRYHSNAPLIKSLAGSRISEW